MDSTLFLIDTAMPDISGLPIFYCGIFKIWNRFKKESKEYKTLHWLLEEPLVYGCCLDISSETSPTLSWALVSSGIVTLWQLVEIAGTELSQVEDLAARIGLQSLHVTNQLQH